MDTLPAELISYLCSFLSQTTLKSLRLCCCSFASIGEDHLFKDFEFRLYPNHHRLYQLEQLSKNARIASKLRCLSFESGVPLEYADYRYWQAQLYQKLSDNWSHNLAIMGSGGSHDSYEEFHTELHSRFTPDMARRYQLYRWHLDQESAQVADKVVQNALIRSMTNLSYHTTANVRFKIVMSEPEITLEDLENFDVSQYAYDGPEQHPDPRRLVMNRRQRCLDHFINFIFAALRSNFELEDLTAVELPYQLLTMDYFDTVGVLEELFSGLQRIDIQIGSLPHSDWLSRQGLSELYLGGRHPGARRLPMLLNCTSKLEHLRLELPHGKEAEYSFDIFDRTNIDRFPKLWLPHLKSFELCKFRCAWTDLAAMLKSAKHLKALVLSDCRLETGSMIELIHFMPQLNLQKLSINGAWYVDEDWGEWHSHTSADFTSCVAATSYEGPYVVKGLRSKVESFMLNIGNNCPLARATIDNHEEEIWEMVGDTSWHYIPGLHQG